MLFRIWQHALMDQPMTVQELWHWVHACYGDELGLTSDDEDYVPPSVVYDKITSKLASEESTPRHCKVVETKDITTESPPMAPRDQLVTDSSDMSETDEDNVQSLTESRVQVSPTTCPVTHEGRMLLSNVFPLGVDNLFTLIFTYNQFNKDLMESLKYTDINIAEWEENSTTGLKMRVNHLVVPVNQPVGPKTCQVIETQILQPSSKVGELYVIETESVNAGVPYCDSFYITTHFCITRVSLTEASFSVHSQIKYRKSVWSLVKNFIEKNVWAGLEDYYKFLAKRLGEECVRKQVLEDNVEVPTSPNKESTKVIASTPQPEPILETITLPVTSISVSGNDIVLWTILGVLAALFVLNAILYYKLSSFQEVDRQTPLSFLTLGEERSHEEWVSLLQKQATQHRKDIEQWQINLKSVVSLLRQAEESINNLQNNIQVVLSERVLASLKLRSDADEISLTKKHSEL